MLEKGKLVVLTLEGDLEQKGFDVTLEISEKGKIPYVKKRGFLQANLSLIKLLDRWQKEYRSLAQNNRIRPKEIIYERPKQVDQGFQELATELSSCLNLWLESESFRNLDTELREQLNLSEEIRVLIRTSDSYLRRLPWELWSFIQKYTRAAIALAPANYKKTTKNPNLFPNITQKVRILAILGDSTGIDTESDRQILKALPNAEVEFLVEPQRYQISDRLWEQPWDILFFAGHSETRQQKGLIHINPAESLTLKELTYSLKTAIENGLQLAIFNSCDGLGLIEELEGLNLPQMILMREPVPDRVAQEFLKYFLRAFAGGTSLYLAQRQAREQLQGWENLFPCASWLPVIYQNPAALDCDWSTLEGKKTSSTPNKPNWPITAITALGITVGLIGLRSLGILQGLELKAFDQFVRLRTPEPIDERILVITVNEEDIRYQQAQKMARQGSLSDVALAQLLNKLIPHHPRVIASDIVHDFDFSPAASLAIKKAQVFIGICRVGNEAHQGDLETIPPPPTLETTQLGFTNFVLDADDVIRRQILGMSKDDICNTDHSFSFRIVRAYLQNIPVEKTDDGLRIGTINLPKVDNNAGGYQLPSQEVLGHQVLINYRATPPRTIPLQEILDGSQDPQLAGLVSDKIILIGVDQDNVDQHLTPYSQGGKQSQLAGVLIQAEMISHLISSVENQRPWFWWWPEWLENIWIVFWSVIAGIAFWLGRSLVKRTLAFTLAFVLLSLISFLVFLQGGWIPFVPALLALGLTGFCLNFIKR